MNFSKLSSSTLTVWQVDSSHQIQLGTVYRGRQKLSDTEVNLRCRH